MNLMKINRSDVYHLASYEVLYTFRQDLLMKLSAETVDAVNQELCMSHDELGWDKADTIETLKLVIDTLCYDGTLIASDMLDEAQLATIDIVTAYYNKYLDDLLK